MINTLSERNRKKQQSINVEHKEQQTRTHLYTKFNALQRRSWLPPTVSSYTTPTFGLLLSETHPIGGWCVTTVPSPFPGGAVKGGCGQALPAGVDMAGDAPFPVMITLSGETMERWVGSLDKSYFFGLSHVAYPSTYAALLHLCTDL